MLCRTTRLAIGLYHERQLTLHAQGVKVNTSRRVRSDMIPAPHIICMTQRITQIVPAKKPDIEQAIIQISIWRKFGMPAEIMSNVGGNCHNEMTLHFLPIGPQSQLNSSPLRR